MRLPFLPAAVLFAAVSIQAQGQTRPASPSLPTVEKPKSKPAAEVPQAPEADPAQPPEEDPDAKPAAPAQTDARGRRKSSGSGDSQSSDNSAPADNTPSPEYTGPAILSRGVNFVRPSLPQNERFRPFAGLSFFHDTGVNGQYGGAGSSNNYNALDGLDLTYGISGQHLRRFDTFQLDYRGHTYVQRGGSNQDQSLSFGYSRVLARRLTATVSESAGLYSSSYAVLNSFTQTDISVANTALPVSPNTESFNDKTYYNTTSVDVAYQRSSRLSFNFGGTSFYVHRNSLSLISANGYQARMDAAYRLSKKSTLGPYYAFSHYDYSGTFGDTGVHTVGLNYSLALNRNLQFGIRGGGSRLETRGLESVALDPAIAAILGTTVGIARYYQVAFVPDVAMSLTRNFRHSNLSVSYLRGVSPGNGVVLTSQHDSEAVTYSYNGIRRYAVTFTGGRDNLNSQTQGVGLTFSPQNTGSFGSSYGRVAVSRTLPRNLLGTLALDYRKLDSNIGQYNPNVAQYNRNQFRITIGMLYSPIAGPLRFW